MKVQAGDLSEGMLIGPVCEAEQLRGTMEASSCGIAHTLVTYK